MIENILDPHCKALKHSCTHASRTHMQYVLWVEGVMLYITSPVVSHFRLYNPYKLGVSYSGSGIYSAIYCIAV